MAIDINASRTRLLQRREELQAIEASSRDATQPVELDQASVGRISRMDAMQGQQMALETARRRQLELTRIEGALRRIDSGDFGFCFKCGEEIDERRLAADVTHTRCLRCAE